MVHPQGCGQEIAIQIYFEIIINTLGEIKVLQMFWDKDKSSIFTNYMQY